MNRVPREDADAARMRAGDRAGRQHVPVSTTRAPDRRDRINLLGIGAVGYHGVFDQEKRSG